jgi:hypothetical protein
MTRNKQVVLCGSMSAYGALRHVHDELEHAGITAVLPTEDEFDDRSTFEEVTLAKRNASLRHFDCIKNESTGAVLVVNVDKNGKHDYIGPNAFAEIAVAIAQGVTVYLLQGVPRQYRDELDAWGVQSLEGDLTRLKWAWTTSSTAATHQLLSSSR